MGFAKPLFYFQPWSCVISGDTIPALHCDALPLNALTLGWPSPWPILCPYRYVLFGWEWHLKRNVRILEIRVIKGIQSPFINGLWPSG